MATITEKTDTELKRDEAERVAWAAPGVWLVDNKIDVKWSWGFGD